METDDDTKTYISLVRTCHPYFLRGIAADGAGAQSRSHTGAISSLEENKALVRRWIEEGFNKRNLKVVDELFVEDFTVNERKIGRAGLKQSMSRHITAQVYTDL